MPLEALPGREPSAACLREGDEAFVEQKNGTVLRRLMGYGRFDGVYSVGHGKAMDQVTTGNSG